jgi:anti-anti-sigma factor
MTEPLCRCEERREGDVLVVELAGEIDLSNATAIEADLRAAFAAERIEPVIVLNGLTYLDSAGIRVLERLMAAHPARVVLSTTSPVHRAMTIAGLRYIAPVFESLAEALN